MGWLIALALVILLAVLPLGISAIYNRSGAFVCLLLGPIRLTLYSRRKSNSKRKASDKVKTSVPDDFESRRTMDDETGGKLTDFIPLVKIALNLLGDLRRKLRVKRLELKLIMGDDDPCDLAVNYGCAWAALGNIMPLLEQTFIIRKRNLEVLCDFTSDETLILARLDVNITVGRLFSISVYHGIRVIREYLKILNKRKGGAIT